MGVFEFFIVPEAVFTAGLILFLLLRIGGETIQKSSVDLQIGKFDKEFFASLSDDGRKRVSRIVLFGTIAITIATCLVSYAFMKIFSCTTVSLIACIFIQIAALFFTGIPFYRRIQSVE